MTNETRRELLMQGIRHACNILVDTVSNHGKGLSESDYQRFTAALAELEKLKYNPPERSKP